MLQLCFVIALNMSIKGSSMDINDIITLILRDRDLLGRVINCIYDDELTLGQKYWEISVKCRTWFDIEVCGHRAKYIHDFFLKAADNFNMPPPN